MSVPHSPTGGVQPFPIGGRLVRERERLLGMSNEERAWRKQYLKDQELSKNEPRFVPEYWKERTNPIRRFYQFPLNTVENIIKPVIVSFHLFWWIWWWCNNNNKLYFRDRQQLVRSASGLEKVQWQCFQSLLDTITLNITPTWVDEKLSGSMKIWFYIKFQDWTRSKGWRVIKSRKQVVPGDEGYPKLSDRSKPSDYAARGFNQSPI